MPGVSKSFLDAVLLRLTILMGLFGSRLAFLLTAMRTDLATE